MRILHVLDHSLPVQSGYAFRSQAILREQRALGWQTEQITSPKHGTFAASPERVNGFEFHRVAGSRSVLGRLPVLNQLEIVRHLRNRLRDVVAETRPDIIQAHSPCLNALAALGLGKPLVYELRSSWEDAAVSSGTTTEDSLRYRVSRALETLVLRRADAVTTICEGLRTEVLRRGVAADRITVVPNAVDADALHVHASAPPDLRRRFGLENACVLGFIGSFFAWEGLPLLLEAIPKILQERPDVRLLLVGTGPDERSVRAAVQRLDLERHVVMTGELPHDHVRAAYDAVDILVYPRIPMRLTEMV
ncbi:MAG: glycosyltransferase, partial [Vitreimonas sp.]